MAESVLQITSSVLSPCSSGRRRNSDSMSPEFEFWMVRNPTLPQPKLLSAAELFSDGVLLPLHCLRRSSDSPIDPNQETSGSDQADPFNAEDSTRLENPTAPTPSAFRLWKDIFKKSDSCKKKEKENKKDISHGVIAAELNINIWPFSRSSSAGNGGNRSRMVTAGTRKVRSAPCSRSNSTGDFKFNKGSANPNQGGVHLSKNGPLWQGWRGGVGGSGGKTTDHAVDNATKATKEKKNEVAENRLPLP